MFVGSKPFTTTTAIDVFRSRPKTTLPVFAIRTHVGQFSIESSKHGPRRFIHACTEGDIMLKI